MKLVLVGIKTQRIVCYGVNEPVSRIIIIVIIRTGLNHFESSYQGESVTSQK